MADPQQHGVVLMITNLPETNLSGEHIAQLTQQNNALSKV